MRNILLTVSYDGTLFCGWQRQDKAGDEAVRTVQGVLETALCRLHRAPIRVCGAGRTDSGVHAIGQAATFMSPIDSIPIERYARAINSFLPLDVRVLKAREVPSDFSARFSATSRVYRYFINTNDMTNAIIPRYSWCIHRKVDIDLLNALAAELHGETDCASFASSEGNKVTDGTSDMPHSTCRYINGMRFTRQDDGALTSFVVFEIEANAYLYHMVRNIVGTLLLLDKRGGPRGALADIAAARDRVLCGPTAPPQGLFLWEVKFDGVRRGGGE